MKKDSSLPQYWWEVLPAIPRLQNSHAYRRLRRSWFDHTWKNHPIFSPRHENHLTATPFENFILFDPEIWVGGLLSAAGIELSVKISACNWGYEILAEKNKLADIAIHTRGANGDHVIIVEAKIKGGALKKTDADPASYLDLAEFSWAPKRSLIYLIDEADVNKTRGLIADPLQRSGILTWQALGGLQVELALQLDCSASIRDFVAGAIQFQYLNHGVKPTKLVADYLAGEPSRADINKENPERMRNWSTDWRIS